jgi:hypothetical protein
MWMRVQPCSCRGVQLLRLHKGELRIRPERTIEGKKAVSQAEDRLAIPSPCHMEWPTRRSPVKLSGFRFPVSRPSAKDAGRRSTAQVARFPATGPRCQVSGHRSWKPGSWQWAQEGRLSATG